MTAPTLAELLLSQAKALADRALPMQAGPVISWICTSDAEYDALPGDPYQDEYEMEGQRMLVRRSKMRQVTGCAGGVCWISIRQKRQATLEEAQRALGANLGAEVTL